MFIIRLNFNINKQLNQIGAEQQGKPHNLTHMHFGGQNPNKYVKMSTFSYFVDRPVLVTL